MPPGAVSASAFAEQVRRGEGEFAPRVRVSIENARYATRTVTQYSELHEACALRHEAFVRPKGGGAEGLDIDAYDVDSDHLVVFEKPGGRVVANYRIRCSLFHDRFYAETEFTLDDLLRFDGEVKLEIGRACLHAEHRHGAPIRQLWKGLREYVRKTQARHIFGCSSVPLGEPGRVEAVWRELNALNQVSRRFRAVPRVPYVLNPEAPDSDARRPAAIPPLMASYFRFGAKILGPPALDAEFHCADFLTLLDVRDLPADRKRQYAP